LNQEPPQRESIGGPGILLGVGLGGFVDGIVLHQILQWHHMLSQTEQYPPTSLSNLQVNTVADGVFHASTWLFVVAGLWWLWKAVNEGGWRWTWQTLLGWMLTGWGIFNLVEGIVDHHLLGIHHVRPAAPNPILWDAGFLIFGAILIALGWALRRRDIRRAHRA
jgi:uncharacterized membrane protein